MVDYDIKCLRPLSTDSFKSSSFILSLANGWKCMMWLVRFFIYCVYIYALSSPFPASIANHTHNQPLREWKGWSFGRLILLLLHTLLANRKWCVVLKLKSMWRNVNTIFSLSVFHKIVCMLLHFTSDGQCYYHHFPWLQANQHYAT